MVVWFVRVFSGVLRKQLKCFVFATGIESVVFACRGQCVLQMPMRMCFSKVAMLLPHAGSQEQGASVWVCVRTASGPACDVKDVKTDVLIGIGVTSVNDVKKRQQNEGPTSQTLSFLKS